MNLIRSGSRDYLKYGTCVAPILGTERVGQNFHLNKVIGNNETGFRGQKDSTYRKEGWEFILAGGALYNNLDYSFTADHEKGDFNYPEKQPGGGSSTLRTQLGHLIKFMHSLDFVRMKPDSTFITEGMTKGSVAYVLSEPGKQYAAYLLRGNQANLLLTLPAGNYNVEWMDPVTGVYPKKETLRHGGGIAKITSPPYAFDLALKVVRKK